MTKEIWENLKLENYEIYEVSTTGKIKRNNRVLKPKKDKYGYLRVNLCVNNKRKTKTIHRLVAETFIKNYNNYPTVNHKDGNKINNNINNLEWVTNLENIKHAQENNLFKFWYKVEVVNEKTNCYIGTYKSIRELCLSLKLINRKEVTMAINNNFSYRGYKFKRIN